LLRGHGAIEAATRGERRIAGIAGQEDRRFAMACSQDLPAFIRATFRSVWVLELLCFLRQNCDRSLSPREMVAGLRGSDLVVTQSVEALAAAGLVIAEADGSARYRPASAGLDELAGRTETFYRTSPDAVRRMIVAAANPGLAAFADSFRLRKD
jgi:hypothetical protein